MSRRRWRCTSGPACRASAAPSAPAPSCSTACGSCFPGWPATAARTGTTCLPPWRWRRGRSCICPECGAAFYAPGAEELAFNSQGACRTCGGTGIVRTVDRSTLVPDESLTIDQGAVAPWNSPDVVADDRRLPGDGRAHRRALPGADRRGKGHRLQRPGGEKAHLLSRQRTPIRRGELDFTYFNAVYTVENALAKVKDEKGMKRVEKFLKEDAVSRLRRHPPVCGGPRAPAARHLAWTRPAGMTLSELARVGGGRARLPAGGDAPHGGEHLRSPSRRRRRRLMDLGLGYLTLDRAASTLSTGERQRMQLARAVRNRTTGVLYVLDEPSIGLHPSNIAGLIGVMRRPGRGRQLRACWWTTTPQVLSQADWIIEMGPRAGARRRPGDRPGHALPSVGKTPPRRIGPFLARRAASGCADSGCPRRAVSTGPHPPVHRRHPHGEAPGGRASRRGG